MFIDSVPETKEKGHLSTSQRQAIIRLIEKNDKDERFIRNWRSISLVNVDLKIISKALSEKLNLDESARLIPDIIEIAMLI